MPMPMIKTLFDNKSVTLKVNKRTQRHNRKLLMAVSLICGGGGGKRLYVHGNSEIINQLLVVWHLQYTHILFNTDRVRR